MVTGIEHAIARAPREEIPKLADDEHVAGTRVRVEVPACGRLPSRVRAEVWYVGQRGERASRERAVAAKSE